MPAIRDWWSWSEAGGVRRLPPPPASAGLSPSPDPCLSRHGRIHTPFLSSTIQSCGIDSRYGHVPCSCRHSKASSSIAGATGLRPSPRATFRSLFDDACAGPSVWPLLHPKSPNVKNDILSLSHNEYPRRGRSSTVGPSSMTPSPATGSGLFLSRHLFLLTPPGAAAFGAVVPVLRAGAAWSTFTS